MKSWRNYGITALVAAIGVSCADVKESPTATASGTGTCGTDPKGMSWEILQESDTLHGTLFSTWGRSASDVWAVGATNKDFPEKGPQLLHWDGTTWTRHSSAATGEMWWVTPGTTEGTLWVAGSQGQILHRGLDGVFSVMQAPNQTQLFGIFALAEDNVYAVGGPPSCAPGQPCGVIWHYDGKAWSADSAISETLRSEASWFKMWGTGPDNLYVVGSAGHILHFDGKAWSDQPTGVNDQLFTVSGNAALAVAVGGLGAGVLLENDGTGWKKGKIKGDTLPGLNGVSIAADGSGVTVGSNGTIWRRCGGTWQEDTALSNEPLDDLHAVWRGPSGDIFAVGGQIVMPPFQGGQLLHFGLPTNAKKISD